MDELGATGESRLSFELTRQDDGSALLTLEGELDMASAPEVEAALEPVIAGGARKVIIDAAGLRFADSSAIALLVRLANAVQEVEIRQPPRLLRDVLARMGLTDRLRLVP